MKTKTKKTIKVLLPVIMIIAGTSLFAQSGRGLGPCGAGNGPGWGFDRSDFQRPARGFGQFGTGYGMLQAGDCPFLDLSDEQVEQIKELRLSHYKEVEPLRAEMSELAVKHRNLMRAENIDTKAVNESIDKKTELMNKLMKKQVVFRTEFLNLLTDEQKMEFEKVGKGYRMNQGMKKGRRQGMGNTGRRGRSSSGRGFNRW